jgi:hypothetical protein
MQATLFGVPAFLAVNLLGLAVVLLALAIAGRHRVPMLAAGAIEMLHALPAPLFDGVYWSPRRAFGLWVGIEDLLLCFTLGAGVWFAAVALLGDRLSYAGEWRGALRRLVLVTLLPLPVVLIRLAGASVMETLLLATLGTGAVLASQRPDLLALSGRAVPLYAAYYIAFLYLCAWLVPGFFALWDGPELWGPRLAGLPLDEVAFILAFAACFPLVAGWVMGVRVAGR